MSREQLLRSFRKSFVFLVFVVAFFAIIFGISKLSNSYKQRSLSQKPIIKDFTVNQLPAISGQPIKWLKTVNASQIDSAGHLLVIPGFANNIKIGTSTPVVKKSGELTNTDRLKLSELSASRSKSEASLALARQIERQKAKGFFAVISRFFSGVGSMFATVGEVTNLSGTSTPDMILVDLSTQIDADETQMDSDTGTQTPLEISTSTEEATTTLSDIEMPTGQALSELTGETLPLTGQAEEDVSTSTEEISTTTLSDIETPTEQAEQTEEPTSLADESASSTLVTVEYETPAPTIAEADTDTGKIVQISLSDTEMPTGQASTSVEQVTDVLAFTNIPEIYKVGQESKIKIKWTNEDNREVAFHAYDLNGNGKLDYVEWTVPHLSTQTFEIIFISKAFQLDTDLTILEDIFDTVRTRDNTFAPITDGQYIRVTFEKILDNTKDITVYARPNGTTTSSIEVYPVYTDADGNQTQSSKLTLVSDTINPTFENIDHDGKYRILLSNLDTPTDVFDLKITGNIDVDYIVDPKGLVSHYKLDDTNGTTVVDNIAGNNGTGTYTASSAGRINGAITLNGSEYLALNSQIVAGTDMTYSVWVKANGVQTGGIIFGDTSLGQDYIFNFYGQDCYVGSGAGGVDQVYWTLTATLTNWTYLTLVKTGTDVELFQNGVSLGTQSISTVSPISWIGKNGTYWTGNIDDIRIYDVALDQSDIEALYQGGTGTQQDIDLGLGLMVHYNMDDNAASTTVEDSSGNNSDGAITQDTEDITTTGKINSALNFNFNETLTNTNGVNVNDDFTIAMWAYYDTRNPAWEGSLFDNISSGAPYNGLKFFFYGDNGGAGADQIEIQLYVENQNFEYWDSVTTFPVDNWYHVVLTMNYATDEMKLYVNNSLIQTFSRSTPIGTNTPSFKISANNSFGGKIDDFRVYNRALRTAEISALYDLGTGTEEQWLQNDGVITTDGDYTVVTYYSNGTFTPPAGVTSVAALVVGGGGGGGGAYYPAGGGGGGAVTYDASYAVSAGTYNVTVGGGGAGHAAGDGTADSGGNSVFGTITSAGGAGGNGEGTGGATTGFTGGAYNHNDPNYSGGGGAGSNENGANGTDPAGGDGGDGVSSTIFDGS